MSMQRQVWCEMLTSGIGLVIGLAADFPCLAVAEQHTVTGQRSSDHDGQETTIERRTRLSCAAGTRQQEGGDERGCFLLGMVVVWLLDECYVEGSGRAKRDD
jgi:hypothetical protein